MLDVIIQIAFALSPNFFLALFCAGAMGFSVTVAGIAGQVMVQSAIHDEMRGRVMSIWGIIMRGGVPTGAFILGLLSSFLGYQISLIILTLLFIIVLIVTIPRSGPLIKRMESPPQGLLSE